MGNAQQAQTSGPILAIGVIPGKNLIPAQVVTVTSEKLDRFNLGSSSRRSRNDFRKSNGNRKFTCACLSTGKGLLVAGDADGYIYIYRTEGAELLQVHKAHDASITVLRWNRRTQNSPERLLSGCRNGIVKLWDLGSSSSAENSTSTPSSTKGANNHNNHGTLLYGRGRSFVVNLPRPLGGSPPGSPKASKRRMSAPRIPASKVSSLIYDGEIGRVYIGYANGSIKSFNTNSGSHLVSNETAHRSEISQMVVSRVDPSILPILDRHVLDTIMHLDLTSPSDKLKSSPNENNKQAVKYSTKAKDFTGSILISASKDGRLKGWISSLENRAPLFDYDIHVSILLPSTKHGGDIVFGGTTGGEIFAWQVSRAGLVTLKKIVQNSFGSIIALDYNHTLDILCMGTHDGYVLLSEKMSEELESNKHDTSNVNINKKVRRLSSTTSLPSPDSNDRPHRKNKSNVKNLKINVDNNNAVGRKHRRRRSNSFTDDTVDTILNNLVEKYKWDDEDDKKADNTDKDGRDNNERSEPAYNRTNEEWIAISQLYSVALKLSKFEGTKKVIKNANDRMKQWFYNKTDDVDFELKSQESNLYQSHISLVDEKIRTERWNSRREHMIQELEQRHALEKTQLLQRLDEEKDALVTALPEARRLMAQASQKLTSSYMESRAYCKAEAAHLAQKTLRTIAKREGAGLPVGDDQSKIPPGSPKGGNNFVQNATSTPTSSSDSNTNLGPGTKIKDRFIIFNRRITVDDDNAVDPKMTTPPSNKGNNSSRNIFEALDILKKQRVIVTQFPPQVPLRTDLRHPGLIPLVDLYSTPQYTCVMKRWVDSSLASYVRSNQSNESMPIPMIADILYRVLEGLKYIHSKELIHREIRPSSIFLLEPPKAKANESHPPRTPRKHPKAFLEHFGVMTALDGTEAIERGSSFAAPEMFGYSAVPSSDIWSVGCVMAWLLQTPVERATSPLFTGKNSREVLTSVSERIGAPTQEELEDIIAECHIPKSGKHILLGLVDGTYEKIKKRIAENSDESSQNLGVKDSTSLSPETRAPLERSISSLEAEKKNLVAKNLLEKMICWRPRDRISIQDALQHDFFKEVRRRYEQKKRESVAGK
jgi:serine/threonine protein kinase